VFDEPIDLPSVLQVFIGPHGLALEEGLATDLHAVLGAELSKLVGFVGDGEFLHELIWLHLFHPQDVLNAHAPDHGFLLLLDLLILPRLFLLHLTL
jgi:hypothetical protein